MMRKFLSTALVLVITATPAVVQNAFDADFHVLNDTRFTVPLTKKKDWNAARYSEWYRFQFQDQLLNKN